MNRALGLNVFSVPNTPEGRQWLSLARKYKNRTYQFHCRGRGPGRNRPDTYSKELPIDKSESIAVYIANVTNMAGTAAYQQACRNREELRQEITNLQAQMLGMLQDMDKWDIRKINDRLDELEVVKETVQTEINGLYVRMGARTVDTEK